MVPYSKNNKYFTVGQTIKLVTTTCRIHDTDGELIRIESESLNHVITNIDDGYMHITDIYGMEKSVMLQCGGGFFFTDEWGHVIK